MKKGGGAMQNQKISWGNLRALTSRITLSEVLIKPLEEKNAGLIKKYSEIPNHSDNWFYPTRWAR